MKYAKTLITETNYYFKEILRRNIEHFLKKRIYEKLVISEMK